MNLIGKHMFRNKLKGFGFQYGCFLKWWYPQNTPKWSFLVGKPMVVGYHHFRKPPYGSCVFWFKGCILRRIGSCQDEGRYGDRDEWGKKMQQNFEMWVFNGVGMYLKMYVKWWWLKCYPGTPNNPVFCRCLVKQPFFRCEKTLVV